jgi:hypothetical protein
MVPSSRLAVGCVVAVWGVLLALPHNSPAAHDAQAACSGRATARDNQVRFRFSCQGDFSAYGITATPLLRSRLHRHRPVSIRAAAPITTTDQATGKTTALSCQVKVVRTGNDLDCSVGEGSRTILADGASAVGRLKLGIQACEARLSVSVSAASPGGSGGTLYEVPVRLRLKGCGR